MPFVSSIFMKYASPVLLFILLCLPRGQSWGAAEVAPPAPAPTLASKGAPPPEAAFLSVDVLNRTARFLDGKGVLAGHWKYERFPIGVPQVVTGGGVLNVTQLLPFVGHGSCPAPFVGGQSRGGAVEIHNRDGRLRWLYKLMNDKAMVHDEALMLPNGNVLMLVWEHKTSEECAAAGRDPALLDTDGLLADAIWEVKPEGGSSGQVVWRWSTWDHAVQNRYPDLPSHGDAKTTWRRIPLDLPRTRHPRPWTGLSHLEYDAAHDLIVVWSRNFNEFWGIDHSSTAKQVTSTKGGALGRGGDLIFRFGNPYGFGRTPSVQDYPPSVIDAGIADLGKGPALCFLSRTSHKAVVNQWIDQVPVAMLVDAAKAETMPVISIPTPDRIDIGAQLPSPASRITGICHLGGDKGWLCTLGKESRLIVLGPSSSPVSFAVAQEPARGTRIASPPSPALAAKVNPASLPREASSISFLLPARTAASTR